MIRDARARRDRDDVSVVVPALEVAAEVREVEPPPVTGVAVPLAPEVTVAELFDDGAVPVVVEPDIWETVDVLPVALVETAFTIRSPSLRIAPAQLRSMETLGDVAIAAPDARIAEPPVRKARPAAVELLRRRPTPPAAFPPAQLREHLVALFRSSRCSAPSDLTLVGIYEKVPGGAIGSVAVDGDTLVVRLVSGRRTRPATLVVGRVKATQELVTIEISA